MENIRNQDGIGPRELLVVSFGTGFPESRRKTIGAIEDCLERQFPDYAVRRALTSGMILKSVARKEGLTMDSISDALSRAQRNGVRELLVQPTTMMDGFEYRKLLNVLQDHRKAFRQMTVGKPLLTSEQDFDALTEILVDAVSEFDDERTAFVWMGHGTEADANRVYRQLQERMRSRGKDRHFVGTVEAEPSVYDVLAQLPPEIHRVILEPLMIVAGDHANHDMAGDQEDSWKTIFSRSGYEVHCVLRGLGELPGIRNLFGEHARQAVPLE